MRDSESRDGNEGILAEKEAQRIVAEFILKRHRGTKLAFHETKLAANSGGAIYHLEGSFQPSSRSLVGRLLEPPTQYTFSAKVDAVQGKVLNYELR